jgi:hypothetical protein
MSKRHYYPKTLKKQEQDREARTIKIFIIYTHNLSLSITVLARSNTGIVGSNPDEVIWLSNWPNPSSRIMALGSTQPLTEMNTRNLPGDKGQPARKADNLTAICMPTV